MVERPIIIIGAGRSGTKLLRTVLSVAPEVAIFPREINYIWRHGNAGYPTDVLTPDYARPEVRQFIQSQFQKFSHRQQKSRIIEKTCANSARVPFVHAVFPDALFVHLIRDGRAVAESARRRWQANPEFKYLLEKLRWVPWQDIPYYCWRYVRYQFGRFPGQADKAQSSWGPRFERLDALVKSKSLLEVCGIQWQTCVEMADTALAQLPSEQTFTLRYEDLIANPALITRKLYEWADLTLTPDGESLIATTVHGGNLEKWRDELSQDELDALIPHIEETLLKHGYEA
jgi:hypothetical protein